MTSSALIEQYRDELPFSDQMLTFDPPIHTAHRALLMRLITPKRLRENEEFMWRLADGQIDEFIERGDGEFIRGYGQPFAMLVVADLLGVPESDHALFRRRLGAGPDDRTGTVGSTAETMAHNPLEFLYEQFISYIEDRRREPRNDVMTGMATATFPDGSIPEAIDVARIAANLFAAGQETSVRLFGTALQRIGDDPELQQRLRDHRELIPNFVEECLRVESPVKGDFRLARVTTELGGVKVPAGTTLMVVNGAANRDPGRFEHPTDFEVERGERAAAPRVRPRPAHVPRRAARARRGSHHHRTAPRPDGRHQDLREGARTRGRPPLRLRADVHPARREPSVSRVRASYSGVTDRRRGVVIRTRSGPSRSL